MVTGKKKCPWCHEWLRRQVGAGRCDVTCPARGSWAHDTPRCVTQGSTMVAVGTEAHAKVTAMSQAEGDAGYGAGGWALPAP